MKIIITDKNGSHVTDIPTSSITLSQDIERAKEKYPPSEFHAEFQTY